MLYQWVTYETGKHTVYNQQITKSCYKGIDTIGIRVPTCENKKSDVYLSPCSKPPISKLPSTPFSCRPSTSISVYLIFLSTIYLILRLFCDCVFGRKTVSFSHRESVSGASPYRNIQYQFLTRRSPLKILFLPCFSVQEYFSLISKCHCYRPNLPKSASPTVHWHHTRLYMFHCTLHHTSSLFWRDPRPAVRHVIAGVATT